MIDKLIPQPFLKEYPEAGGAYTQSQIVDKLNEVIEALSTLESHTHFLASSTDGKTLKGETTTPNRTYQRIVSQRRHTND